MKFLSLEPFIPSGSNWEIAKEFFREIGFTVNWDAGDYVGFQRDDCRFILQKYDAPEFAANLMLSVKLSSILEFQALLKEKDIAQRFGVKVGAIKQEAYGKELNIIDTAGVCWHFVEQ
jgi:hypothetical protein